MRGKYTRTERFIKVMMPGFHEKLNLPQAFCKKHAQDKLYEAVIKSPIGTCEVQVFRDQTGIVSFEDGWPGFVHRHGLSFGDFVMFEHTGNFHFNATVFEPSACEKEYFLGELKKEPKEEYFLGEPKIEPKEEHFLGELKKEPKDHGPKTSKRAAEKKPAISHQSKNSYFTQTIQPYHVRTGHEMGIPINFSRSNSIGDKTNMILRGPDGREWPVNICMNKRGSQLGRCRMVGGWHDFHVGNKLKLGDVCTFELISRDSVGATNNVVMEVSIFPAPS